MHTAMKPLVQATSSHHTAKTLAQSGSAARTSKKAVPYNLSTPGTLNLAGNTVSVKTGAGFGTAAAPVAVTATQLNIENTTSGDVVVTNTGHINVTGAASNVNTAHLVQGVWRWVCGLHI